ncbi:hypothetical protein WIW50_18860 [Flavobacteriaceae bacterium 3-367]|uniref:hypothetical protein n=1 Tax=Eudoraea algarum TaxID=3417568 RepID=UPI003286D1CE
MSKNTIKPYQRSLNQLKFEKAREEYADREILMELLYSNWIIQQKSERNRKNISIITWILIIYVIMSILIGILVGLGIDIV